MKIRHYSEMDLCIKKIIRTEKLHSKIKHFISNLGISLFPIVETSDPLRTFWYLISLYSLPYFCSTQSLGSVILWT